MNYCAFVHFDRKYIALEVDLTLTGTKHIRPNRHGLYTSDVLSILTRFFWRAILHAWELGPRIRTVRSCSWALLASNRARQCWTTLADVTNHSSISGEVAAADAFLDCGRWPSRGWQAVSDCYQVHFREILYHVAPQCHLLVYSYKIRRGSAYNCIVGSLVKNPYVQFRTAHARCALWTRDAKLRCAEP